MADYMLDGAMSVEATLPRLCRTPNKAVITGGGRMVIQLATYENLDLHVNSPGGPIKDKEGDGE